MLPAWQSLSLDSGCNSLDKYHWQDIQKFRIFYPGSGACRPYQANLSRPENKTTNHASEPTLLPTCWRVASSSSDGSVEISDCVAVLFRNRASGVSIRERLASCKSLFGRLFVSFSSSILLIAPRNIS